MPGKIDIEKLKAKHEEELREAETRNAIVDALEELGLPAPYFVCFNNLYGKKGMIRYDIAGYPSSSELTWRDAADILEALQPWSTPVCYLKTQPYAPSFVPCHWANAVTEEQREKEAWVALRRVSPLTARVNGFGLKFASILDVPGRGLFEVEFSSHSFNAAGQFTSRRVNYPGGVRYENKGFQWLDSFFLFRRALPRQTLPIWAQSPFKGDSIWSSPDQPGDFYGWWELPEEGPTPTAAEILRFCVCRDSN